MTMILNTRARTAACSFLVAALALSLTSVVLALEPCWRWQRLDAADGLLVGDVYKVAAGGGSLVAFEGHGGWFSDDGAHWRNLQCAGNVFECSTLKVADAVWTGESFVGIGSNAIGCKNFWITGDTVQPILPCGSARYSAIAFNGSQLVAVGGGLISFSDELLLPQWQMANVNSGLGGWLDLRDVCWTGDQWVAVGRQDWEAVILSSSDGVEWTVFHPGGSGVWGVAASNEMVVAVGDPSLMSVDGVTWTEVSGLPVGMKGVTWSGSEWIAVGQGAVLTSHDGVNWEPAGTSSGCLLDVAHHRGATVAVGEGVITSSVDDGPLTDLAALRPSALDLLWNGERFVAAGWGRLHASSDGRSWQRVECDIGSRAGSFHPALHDLGWNGETLMVVGRETPNPDWDEPVIMSSTDGLTWVDALASGETASSLSGVVWGNDEWVVYGRDWWNGHNSISVSADGHHWEEMPGQQYIEDLIWDGLRYVALTVDGATTNPFLQSPWTPLHTVWETYPGAQPGLRWNGSQYLVFAAGGFLATSADVVTWSRVGLGTDSTFDDAVWTGTEWIVVTEDAQLYSSPDGAVWGQERVGWPPTPRSEYDRFTLASNGVTTVALADGVTLIRTCDEQSGWLDPGGQSLD